MITAPLTLHLLLMQISSPDFLLYSKPKQEILDRVIKISCCFVVTYDLEHLPRLPWDLFSPEEEDKTRTGEVFNNAGPRKGQRRFSVLWLRLVKTARQMQNATCVSFRRAWRSLGSDPFLSTKKWTPLGEMGNKFSQPIYECIELLGMAIDRDLMFHTLYTETDTRIFGIRHFTEYRIRILSIEYLIYFQSLRQLQAHKPYTPTRKLRSSSKNLLVTPKSYLKFYGDRSFQVAAPRL